MTSDMSLNNYISQNKIWEGDVPEIDCYLTVFKLDSHLSADECVRVYATIKSKHPTPTSNLDINYSESDYEKLIAQEELIDNLSYHYLNSHTITRRFDEYFH